MLDIEAKLGPVNTNWRNQMGLHLLPFLASTAVGALLTYLVKDEEARRETERIIDPGKTMNIDASGSSVA
jgi:hypothetical protein